MRFEKRYCVVRFFPSGVTRKILETFDTRQAADYAIFDLVKSHKVPIGDFIGIYEVHLVQPDKAEAPQPAAKKQNGVS